MDDPIKKVLERYGPVNKEMLQDLKDTLPGDHSHQWLIDNDEMRTIIVDILMPAVMGRWLRKNEDYRGQQMFLGVKAQFIDINRKFWKLFHVVWEGHLPEFESEAELKMDLIGHLLMSLYLQRPEYWKALWTNAMAERDQHG